MINDICYIQYSRLLVQKKHNDSGFISCYKANEKPLLKILL